MSFVDTIQIVDKPEDNSLDIMSILNKIVNTANNGSFLWQLEDLIDGFPKVSPRNSAFGLQHILAYIDTLFIARFLWETYFQFSIRKLFNL